MKLVQRIVVLALPRIHALPAMKNSFYNLENVSNHAVMDIMPKAKSAQNVIQPVQLVQDLLLANVEDVWMGSY